MVIIFSFLVQKKASIFSLFVFAFHFHFHCSPRARLLLLDWQSNWRKTKLRGTETDSMKSKNFYSFSHFACNFDFVPFLFEPCDIHTPSLDPVIVHFPFRFHNLVDTARDIVRTIIDSLMKITMISHPPDKQLFTLNLFISFYFVLCFFPYMNPCAMFVCDLCVIICL